MRHRQPSFDFSQTRAQWAPVPEFAHAQNGLSVGVPALERFLNRVMAKAYAEIKGDDPASVQLRAEISTFIKQETAHYSMHEKMNAALVRDGYDRIPEIQKEIAAHYARLLETRSLAFLLAYSEGFETIGPMAAMAWCGDSLDEYLQGADPNVVMMYRWHLLEEYEHRTVCYDVFKRIHGGYFLRIYGFFYQFYCLSKLSGKVRKYLLAVDRAGMTAAQVKASKQREKAVAKAMAGAYLGNLFKILRPSYRPHTIPFPKMWKSIELEIDTFWMKQQRRQGSIDGK